MIHSQSRKHLQDKSDSVNPENTYKIKVIHSQSRKHLQDQSDSQSIQKTPTRSKLHLDKNLHKFTDVKQSIFYMRF